MKCMDLQLFVEDAPVAVALFDRDMRYVAASAPWRAGHKLDNFSVADCIGDADEQAQMREGFRRALRGETIILPAARLALPGGGARCARLHMRPWRHQRDEIVGVVVCVEDASPDFHQHLIDAAPLGICLLDIKGNIVFANPGMGAMLGAGAEALPGRPLISFLAPEHVAPARERLESGMEQAFDARLQHRDATQSWVSLSFRPLLDNGARTGVLATLTDITERVARDTRMRAEVRSAEESDRRKNRFLGALAHELRTPLATIVLTVETLVADAPTDHFRTALDRVIRQGRRLARLVSELAGVTSLCEGETDLRQQRVDLVALLTQVVELVRDRIDEKGCTLVLRLPDAPLPIMGDAELLVQAFRTLLENAVTFSPSGGRITLAAQRRGTAAVVTVRDEGIGITADLLPLIFEPFERKARPGRKGEGLGVALALARGWMRLHGGDMRAESGGKDKGSLFEARLPLTRA